MSHLSRAEARSREQEAQADRTRKPVEEPDRAASVQILEDEQSRMNGVPNRESGRGRPVADPQAKAWLDSMQRFRLDREHQINQILQREAYGSLSEQYRLSFAR